MFLRQKLETSRSHIELRALLIVEVKAILSEEKILTRKDYLLDVLFEIFEIALVLILFAALTEDQHAGV